MLAVFAVSAVASGTASATGQCYKVSTAKTGRFETWQQCATGGPTVAEGQWINVSNLETELKPGEWCAKVEPALTGDFEENKCATAKAKHEFIKVHVPGFWLCREGGTEKYANHSCNIKTETGKESFLPVETAEVYLTEGRSGVSKIDGTIGGGRVLIECKKGKMTGELESGGRTKNIFITSEECKLFTVAKYTKTATTCVVPNLETSRLNDYLVMGKGIGPEGAIETAVASDAILTVTLEACALEGKYSLTGKQICRLSEETVGLVEHELVCSPSGGALKFEGEPASYYGTALVKLTNGWTWGAEP
jgi:hypothetical protein